MVARTPGEVVGPRLCVGALAALLGGLGLQPTSAQNSDAVTVDVAPCTHLESAEARLACFGARVDAVLEQRGLTEERKDRAARRNDERSSRQEQRAERRAERGSNADPRLADAVEESGEAEYTGTIVAIRERLPNAYVITLDNGQIWQQTEPKQYPLRPGAEVRLYPTRWGTYYRLHELGSGSHIQVRKVQ